MSLAQAQDRLQLPDSLRDQLLGFSPAGLVHQAGRSRLLRPFSASWSFLLMFAIDRVWDTPAWARAVVVRLGLGWDWALLPLAIHRWVWRQSPARSTGPAALPRGAPDRRPVAGRHRAGHAIDSEQARSRTLCEAADQAGGRQCAHRGLPRRGAEPAAPALGLAGRGSRRGGLSRFLTIFPGRRHAPRRGCSPLGKTPRGTRSRRSVPLPGTLVVATWRAVLDPRPALEAQHRLAAARGRGPDRRSAADHRQAQRRPIRVRAAVANRFRLAGSQDRRLGAARSRRADAAARADLGRGRRVPPRVSGSSPCRFKKTFAAAWPRWSKGSAASFTAKRSRELSSPWLTARTRQPGARPFSSPVTRSKGREPWNFAGKTASAWPGKLLSLLSHRRPRRRGPHAPRARTCPARKWCSIPS